MKYLVLLLAVYCIVSTNRNAEASVICVEKYLSIHKSDSLKEVMRLFLWYDNYSTPKKWVLEEKDIDEVFKAHPEWIKRFLLQILDKYDDLPFYIRANLSSYLYQEGEKNILKI